MGYKCPFCKVKISNNMVRYLQVAWERVHPGTQAMITCTYCHGRILLPLRGEREHTNYDLPPRQVLHEP